LGIQTFCLRVVTLGYEKKFTSAFLTGKSGSGIFVIVFAAMFSDGIIKILYVALGGASGAVARYLINISPLGSYLQPFPFHTFIINITGSFLIGFLTAKLEMNEAMKLLLLTGFLGAYTTFSTFELETFDLMRERNLLTATLYVGLSFAVGFIGVALGVWLGRKV
jgi:CrcB protein